MTGKKFGIFSDARRGRAAVGPSEISPRSATFNYSVLYGECDTLITIDVGDKTRSVEILI